MLIRIEASQLPGREALPAEAQVGGARAPVRPAQPLAVDVRGRGAVEVEARHLGAVEPGAHGAVRPVDGELQAGPLVHGQGHADRDSGRALLGQRRVVGLAVLLQCLVLPAQPQVLVAVGRVGEGREGDVAGRRACVCRT